MPAITMIRPRGAVLPAHPLPRGFSFKLFESTPNLLYEKAWARVEHSVNAFPTVDEALAHFHREFSPYPDELSRRMVFVIDDTTNEPIATITAWWGYMGVHRRPRLHWLSLLPTYHGRGIGKALVAEITLLMTEIDGEDIFYLITGEHRVKAMDIYKWAGYCVDN